MEGFERKAEDCGLHAQSEWELQKVMEQGSRGQVGVLETELPPFSFSLPRASFLLFLKFSELEDAQDHSELLLFCLQYNAHVGESSGPSPCIHRDSYKPTDPERRSTLSKMTCTVQLTEHLLKTLPIDAHSCSIPILLLGPQPRGWGFFVLFCFLLFDNQ